MRIVRLSENDYGVYSNGLSKGPFRTFLQFRGTREECDRAVELARQHGWIVCRAMLSWPVPADVDAARREQDERERALKLLASCAV